MRGSSGGSSRCLGVGGFLFTRLDRHVMAHSAAGNRAEHRVMMCIMAGYAPDDRAFKAPGLGRHGSAGYQKSRKHSCNLARHPILRI